MSCLSPRKVVILKVNFKSNGFYCKTKNTKLFLTNYDGDGGVGERIEIDDMILFYTKSDESIFDGSYDEDDDYESNIDILESQLDDMSNMINEW